MLFSHIAAPLPDREWIESTESLGRVAAEDVLAPHDLPEFPRSTVDGYAVHAADTFGASDGLPAYLKFIGEVPMGAAPDRPVGGGECALIHTGGMLPQGSDAVVMLEHTQTVEGGVSGVSEIEVLRPAAEGENTLRVGEDVAAGAFVIVKGTPMTPAAIGGLMALGVLCLRVARIVKIGLISTGDEVVPPAARPRAGQVRDVNSQALRNLIRQAGGDAVLYGIFPDDMAALTETARKALSECDAVVITAGSSASSRDMTSQVIDSLGEPGVLVHGINTRPGKPTILGVCGGKAVIGLPGNPVSALVNGVLFILPLIERLTGKTPTPAATVQAQLTLNLPSQAGREDWWPVRLLPASAPEEQVRHLAEPVHGKSNLIFTLARADGLLKIPADATGLSAGEIVEVMLLR